jgi:hypothetical protein
MAHAVGLSDGASICARTHAVRRTLKTMPGARRPAATRWRGGYQRQRDLYRHSYGSTSQSCRSGALPDLFILGIAAYRARLAGCRERAQ